MLTNEEIADIEKEITILPERRSACIKALRVVQRRRRWVTDESLKDVAEFLDMSPAEVEAIATFYNLIFRRPVGRHVVFVCDSVSCWIVGQDRLRHAIASRLGVDFGETTPDDRFTVLPIQCLGACEVAPAVMVDEDLHVNVTDEGLTEILGRYE